MNPITPTVLLILAVTIPALLAALAVGGAAIKFFGRRDK